MTFVAHGIHLVLYIMYEETYIYICIPCSHVLHVPIYIKVIWLRQNRMDPACPQFYHQWALAVSRNNYAHKLVPVSDIISHYTIIHKCLAIV